VVAPLHWRNAKHFNRFGWRPRFFAVSQRICFFSRFTTNDN